MNGFFTHCRKNCSINIAQEIKTMAFKNGLNPPYGILKDAIVQQFSTGDIQ
jgi:hypothetical protein